MTDGGWISRVLVLSNLASWVALVLLAAHVFSAPEHPRFTEIDAERLNILGEEGQPVLVLANRRLMPGPRINGKEYPPRSPNRGAWSPV
jgi:hypothetical protein